ncbi:MAG: YbaK/EbsC family protein [Candidatus Pacebacteria bacterium]|jgi:Ala-tRNA(Pro) deacylase|nr:YbaK/EbsC family protein [Candidatus Paceibacterota bacterium]
MPISKRVLNFIGDAKCDQIAHKTVFTAHDKAATLKIPEKTVGKTLVMKLDKELGLVLISANRNLDKDKLKKLAGAKKVDFATERLFKNRIKGIKAGAVPPLGGPWKLPVFADRAFLKNAKIVINSGDNKWSIRMTPAAYKKLLGESLAVGNISKSRK